MSQISEDAVRIALASAREQLTAEITEAIEHAVREERAAVVAWLRREITKCGCDDDTAACIERGEHRREEER
jgi:uncharacterized protein (DUF885 family)